MKKITLMLALALASFGMNAQNNYTFTATTGQTYTNLEGATSINNGEVWDLDYYGEFTIPFSFSVDGETVDRFFFDDDYFGLLATGADIEDEEGFYGIIPDNFFIQDRGANTSVSPISYKVEGETGNRILKLEMRNAGLEETEGIDTDDIFMNFQIWLYESDKSIEIRYGENNVSQAFIDAFTADDELFASFIGSTEKLYIAYGNSATPTYAEFTEDTLPQNPTNLNSYPTNGTVYRFDPDGNTNSAPVFAKNTLSIYPNPASTVLNVKMEDTTEAPYAVYNMMGSVVARGTLTGTDMVLNISNLQSGVYVLNIAGQNQKFIKQ